MGRGEALVEVTPCRSRQQSLGYHKWQQSGVLALLVAFSVLCAAAAASDLGNTGVNQTCVQQALRDNYLSCSKSSEFSFEPAENQTSPREFIVNLLNGCLSADFISPHNRLPDVKVLLQDLLYVQLALPFSYHFEKTTGIPFSATEAATAFELAQLVAVSAASPLAASDPNSHDLWLMDPAQWGDVMEYDKLADLEALATYDSTLRWSELQRGFRLQLLQWDSRVVGLPLTVAAYQLYYRQDIFQRDGLVPPATWNETLALAMQYNGTAEAAKPLYGFCLHPAACGHDATYLSIIAATMIQTGGPASGLYFDLSTMEPLVGANAATAEALRVLRALRSVSAPSVLASVDVGCAATYVQAFHAGLCLMTLDLPTLFKAVSAGTSTSPVRGSLGSAAVPGSTLVLDRSSKQLTACTPAGCPMATQVKDEQEERFVLLNTVVPVAATVASINARDDLMHQFYAYSLMSYILGTPVALPITLLVQSDVFPIYRSHFNLSLWVGIGYHAGDSKRFLTAYQLATDSTNIVVPPRFANASRYKSALDAAATNFSDRSSTQDLAVAVAAVAEAGRALLRTGDAERMRRSYLKSINAYRQGQVPGSDASAPPPQSGLRPGIVAAIVVPSVLLAILMLLVAVYFLVPYLRTALRRRDTWAPVAAPGVGPDTTLVITDIENSTGLWESLPEEVMNRCLSLHDQIMRAALAKWRGYESFTEGDSFTAAFARPSDALGFALGVQQQLLDADWPAALLQMPYAKEVWVAPAQRPAGKRGFSRRQRSLTSSNSRRRSNCNANALLSHQPAYQQQLASVAGLLESSSGGDDVVCTNTHAAATAAATSAPRSTTLHRFFSTSFARTPWPSLLPERLTGAGTAAANGAATAVAGSGDGPLKTVASSPVSSCNTLQPNLGQTMAGRAADGGPEISPSEDMSRQTSLTSLHPSRHPSVNDFSRTPPHPSRQSSVTSPPHSAAPSFVGGARIHQPFSSALQSAPLSILMRDALYGMAALASHTAGAAHVSQATPPQGNGSDEVPSTKSAPLPPDGAHPTSGAAVTPAPLVASTQQNQQALPCPAGTAMPLAVALQGALQLSFREDDGGRIAESVKGGGGGSGPRAALVSSDKSIDGASQRHLQLQLLSHAFAAGPAPHSRASSGSLSAAAGNSRASSARLPRFPKDGPTFPLAPGTAASAASAGREGGSHTTSTGEAAGVGVVMPNGSGPRVVPRRHSPTFARLAGGASLPVPPPLFHLTGDRGASPRPMSEGSAVVPHTEAAEGRRERRRSRVTDLWPEDGSLRHGGTMGLSLRHLADEASCYRAVSRRSHSGGQLPTMLEGFAAADVARSSSHTAPQAGRAKFDAGEGSSGGPCLDLMYARRPPASAAAAAAAHVHVLLAPDAALHVHAQVLRDGQSAAAAAAVPPPSRPLSPACLHPGGSYGANDSFAVPLATSEPLNGFCSEHEPVALPYCRQLYRRPPARAVSAVSSVLEPRALVRYRSHNKLAHDYGGSSNPLRSLRSCAAASGVAHSPLGARGLSSVVSDVAARFADERQSPSDSAVYSTPANFASSPARTSAIAPVAAASATAVAAAQSLRPVSLPLSPLRSSRSSGQQPSFTSAHASPPRSGQTSHSDSFALTSASASGGGCHGALIARLPLDIAVVSGGALGSGGCCSPGDACEDGGNVTTTKSESLPAQPTSPTLLRWRSAVAESGGGGADSTPSTLMTFISRAVRAAGGGGSGRSGPLGSTAGGPARCSAEQVSALRWVGAEQRGCASFSQEQQQLHKTEAMSPGTLSAAAAAGTTAATAATGPGGDGTSVLQQHTAVSRSALDVAWECVRVAASYLVTEAPTSHGHTPPALERGVAEKLSRPRRFGESLRQQWRVLAPADAAAPPADKVLAFRGFRVRIGLHSGLYEQSDIVNTRSGARTKYSGEVLMMARIISSAPPGGITSLSGDCVARLPRQWLQERGVMLLFRGRQQLYYDAPPIDMYDAFGSRAMTCRVAVVALPLRPLVPLIPGSCWAPVEAVVLVRMQVVGAAALLAWDLPLGMGALVTFAEVVDKWLEEYGGVRVELADGVGGGGSGSRGNSFSFSYGSGLTAAAALALQGVGAGGGGAGGAGGGAAGGHGLPSGAEARALAAPVVVAFTSAAAAALWALNVRQDMVQQDWDPALLAHELCEEVCLLAPQQQHEAVAGGAPTAAPARPPPLDRQQSQAASKRLQPLWPRSASAGNYIHNNSGGDSHEAAAAATTPAVSSWGMSRFFSSAGHGGAGRAAAAASAAAAADAAAAGKGGGAVAAAGVTAAVRGLPRMDGTGGAVLAAGLPADALPSADGAAAQASASASLLGDGRGALARDGGGATRKGMGAPEVWLRGPRLKGAIDVGLATMELNPITGRVMYQGRVASHLQRVMSKAKAGQIVCSARFRHLINAGGHPGSDCVPEK